MGLQVEAWEGGVKRWTQRSGAHKVKTLKGVAGLTPDRCLEKRVVAGAW